MQNPVMLAAGAAGCGEAHWPELEMRSLGALVAGPVTLQNRAGAPMPRLVETTAGMVLETGSQNRGLAATLRLYAPLWARLGIPVVVQLADARPEALARAAARLSAVAGVGALEWRIPLGADAAVVERGVDAILRAGDLPLWAKLPWDQAVKLATSAAACGANALVVSGAPLGAVLVEESNPWLLHGSTYGPALHAQMLHNLARIAALGMPTPLIACGGIYSLTQARAALAAGARAIQLDGVAWIEPTLPGALAAAFAT